MLQMYREPLVLDRNEHRQLRIAPPRDFAFARREVVLPLTLPEFSQAAHEFPIVFTDAVEGPRSVALAGIRPGENLFVTDDGRWDARYRPAILRRYPFVLAERSGSAEPLVCIDAAHPGYGADDGEILFTDDGEPTRHLAEALEFLRAFRFEATRTRAAVGQFERLGLLQPMKANFEPVGAEPCCLDGFRVIDAVRLCALPGDELETLARSGALAAAWAHLFSLDCFARLLTRAARPARVA